MTHTLIKTATLIAAVSTSACVVSEPGDMTNSVDATEFSRGTSAAALDLDTGTMRLNGNVVSQDSDPTYISNGQARVTQSQASPAYTARASNGDVYAVASATRFASSLDASGAVVGRVGSSELPTTGSATFNGDYTSTIMANPGASDQSVRYFTTGDAMISADFAAGTTSGGIDNRAVFNSSGTPLNTTVNNITLKSGSLSNNGTFNGSAVNGQMILSGVLVSSSNGAYSGVIGGDTNLSTAGYIELDLDPAISGTPLKETGVFIAD